MKIKEIFWAIVRDCGRLWEILGDFKGFWKIMGNSGEQVLNKIKLKRYSGRFWDVLGDSGEQV